MHMERLLAELINVEKQIKAEKLEVELYQFAEPSQNEFLPQFSSHTLNSA